MPETPSSQEMESPANPGRFIIQLAWIEDINSVELWRWGAIVGGCYVAALYLFRWHVMKKAVKRRENKNDS